MKHRALSMLLALIMVVSLLPIAVVAGDANGDNETAGDQEESLEPVENTVGLTPDNGPKELFIGENGTTYYLGIAEENRLFGPNAGCDLSSDDASCKFAFSAQVFTKDGDEYVQVDDTMHKDLADKYFFDLRVYATASCKGYYYPKLENGFYRFTTKSLGDWIIQVTAIKKGETQGVTYTAQLTVMLKRTQPKDILGMSNGGDFVKKFELSEGEYDDIMLAVGDTRLDSSDAISEDNIPAEGKLTYGGAVKKIEYTGGPRWRITIEGSAEANSTGWIQYGLSESNRITIVIPQPSGQLEVNYDNGFMRNITLIAGTHDVELRLKDSGNEWQLGAKYADQLSVDKTVVRSIKKHEFTDGKGKQYFFWTIELAEPQGEQTSGWIQYGTDESNRVTITVKPSHGGAVDPETTIYKQGSDEFEWASWGTVMPFEWNGTTYYLGTAEWKSTVNQMASPYALGGRGVNEDEAFYAACVFELKSGEVGNRNATYALREDIRKAMIAEGYQFELTLVPTDIGCEYYPVMETVQKTVTWDENSGENGSLTSEWQGQKFSKTSVGIWVYDARVIDPNGKQLQQNLSNCKYSYTVEDTVKLNGNVEEINKTIAAVLQEKDAELGNAEMQKNGLYNGMVTFIMPSGTLAGEIVIPDTSCIVTVYGNNYRRGGIATTLKGSIRFDNDNTNHVGYIHFIGAGRDNLWANEEKTIRNEAINGIGQGAPENCIFEEYDIAIHSSTRPSWGSRNSIYLNNNVAICQNSNNGGQPFMQNNWFVGNTIAVMLKEVFAVGSLRTFQNRFVNNGTDFGNETGKPYDSETGSILWVSENFFCHDSSWQPQKSDMWSEENGVIYLNYNREGMLLIPNAPSFDETGDYKGDVEAYKAFLPRFSGWTPVYAYPLARSQFCDTFFYPNFRDPSYCPQWWSKNDPYYPSYVRQGSKISTYELDGSRFSSYDSDTDTAVGTFEFSASAAEAEN